MDPLSPADFHVFGSQPGDGKYSRRKNRRFCGAGSLTTARSAGSYREFLVYQKWGQKHGAGISFGVSFPENLETQRKSRGHAWDMHGFLLLCHTVPAGAPASRTAPLKAKK